MIPRRRIEPVPTERPRRQPAEVIDIDSALVACWCTAAFVRVAWADIRACLTLPCDESLCRRMDHEERGRRATDRASIYHDGPGAVLLHGDTAKLADYIEPESVDLIITSPPYFALRSYQDDGEHYDGQIGSEPTPREFLEALWKVTEQCQRVLRPTGSMFVNLGDKYALNNRAWPVPQKSLCGIPWRYAIGCTDGDAGDPWTLRAEIVWAKVNGLPESVTDRVRRSHENWFHMTKEPRYFAAVDEVREPCEARPTALTYEQRKQRGMPMDAAVVGARHSDVVGTDNAKTPHPLDKLPGSVWTVPSEPLQVPDWLGVDHFAAFPQEFPRRLILGWSPSGYCVECNEPRRAVVAKDATGKLDDTSNWQSEYAYHQGATGKRHGKRPVFQRDASATITGYACACDDTKAPTRPAVVLDPFMGTGTTLGVARALGRQGIGLDLSKDYLRLAKWRVFDSGHFAKTLARTNRENQGEMFGGAA